MGDCQDRAIADALDVSISTVERVRIRFVSEMLESASKSRRPNPDCDPTLDGQQEALLTELTSRSPPEGSGRWRLRLLAHQVVQLRVVNSLSQETVRQGPSGVLARFVGHEWRD